MKVLDHLTLAFRRLHWHLPEARLKARGVVLEKRRVLIDYADLGGVTLKDCEVVYAGGPIKMSGCKMDHCTFSMIGAAGNTLPFLKRINGMPGGRDVIEKTFPPVT